MTTKYPAITVATWNPDPSNAISAFLWCMAKARDLGMVPPTEHTLAEHLFRKDAKLIFYSSCGGITALCMDEGALSEEDSFDMLLWVAERRKKRLAEARAAAASAIEAGTGETGTGSTAEGGESAVGAEGDETPNCPVSSDTSPIPRD
jgi:hypothetical protein